MFRPDSYTAHDVIDKEVNDMAEEKNQEEGTEMISFGIIAAAGTARSCAFNALAAAEEGNFDEADKLMKESEEAALEAHHQQTNLLVKEANGDHTPVDVMLVHAQDHLMTSLLARELIAEIIKLRREIASK